MSIPTPRLLAALAVIVASHSAMAETFTLVVQPDPQIAVRSKPGMTASQMDWIVKNRTPLNIPFVICVGDVIDWDTPDHAQWITASRCFDVLDRAKIPYAIAVGNHDTAAVKEGGSAAPGNVRENVRDTTKFNRFFPVTRFPAQRGRQVEGKSDNAWYSFHAGGVDWLVLALELWARPEAVAWANTVAAAYPNHNIIVVTHAHLDAKGGIQQNNGGYGAQSPQVVFDEFIKQHANVRLVLSGHVGDSGWRADKGAKGNTIYQILQCYQHRDAGGGYLRLLEIDTAARTIRASMYSPFHDTTLPDASAFSFREVDFVPAARDWPIGQ